MSIEFFEKPAIDEYFRPAAENGYKRDVNGEEAEKEEEIEDDDISVLSKASSEVSDITDPNVMNADEKVKKKKLGGGINDDYTAGVEQDNTDKAMESSHDNEQDDVIFPHPHQKQGLAFALRLEKEIAREDLRLGGLSSYDADEMALWEGQRDEGYPDLPASTWSCSIGSKGSSSSNGNAVKGERSTATDDDENAIPLNKARGGFLCDSVSMGKISVVIALILANPLPPNEVSTDAECEKLSFSTTGSLLRPSQYLLQSAILNPDRTNHDPLKIINTKTTLILTPAVMNSQLVSELEKLAPELKVGVILGGKQVEIVIKKITSYDVVISTPGIAKWNVCLPFIRFHRVVIITSPPYSVPQTLVFNNARFVWVVTSETFSQSERINSGITGLIKIDSSLTTSDVIERFVSPSDLEIGGV
jgi:hypothetical protein